MLLSCVLTNNNSVKGFVFIIYPFFIVYRYTMSSNLIATGQEKSIGYSPLFCTTICTRFALKAVEIYNSSFRIGIKKVALTTKLL
jgi:hypothetical protein